MPSGPPPDPRDVEMLNRENLDELRRNLAHLSLDAVQRFFDRAHQNCRMIHGQLPSPKNIQTLVTVWKQL